jgi:hypothetical protein
MSRAKSCLGIPPDETLVHLHHLSKIKNKLSHKIIGIKVLPFLHDDRRIWSRIRIHTSD